jgi:uncharacterized protein YndB with AHSA1/START domain
MKNSMKLLAAAGVALLCISPAFAQESGHLSAEFLKQATPLIHWPKGLEPRNVDVFVHNEGWIDATPAVVWKNLVDASQWPTWYSNSADVLIEGGHDTLVQGVSFRWKTFGFPIESTVDTFTPNREIGWSVHKAGFDVHHAWVLVPEKGGVRVITEESQKGADAIAFRQTQPNAMYDGHDWWLSALKARAELTAHSPAPATSGMKK